MKNKNKTSNLRKYHNEYYKKNAEKIRAQKRKRYHDSLIENRIRARLSYKTRKLKEKLGSNKD